MIRTKIGLAVLSAAVAIACGTMSSPLAAQLASRPAEEWAKVLDSPARLAGLRADEVVAKLKIARTDVVADLGAGTGPFVVPFAKAASAGTVYAVEIDKNFFPLIEQKAKTAGVTNVRTVFGGFSDPRLPVTNLDVAFMHDVLHHVENRGEYVKNLAGYLKQRARIAIVDYEPSHSPHRDQPAMMISKDQARALFAEIGFKTVEEIALFPDKWFLVFRR